MSNIKRCACGCGGEIAYKYWHKSRPVKYISGHNSEKHFELSKLDSTRDRRKGQTGLLAVKKVNQIKHDAIKAGHSWNLNQVDVYKMIVSSCSYCGTIPDYPNERNGIDRIDSSIGYEPMNVRPCCIKCNRSKSNMSEEDFFVFIEVLYKNLLKTKRVKNV